MVIPVTLGPNTPWIVSVLTDCPAYSTVAHNASASAKLEPRIEGAMRKLQIVSTPALKTALRVLVARAEPGTPEFARFKHLHPNLPDRKLAALAAVPISRIIWIDRYLFRAPKTEKAGLAFLPLTPTKGGQMDRLFPLENTPKGPRLMKLTSNPQPLDRPPGPTEFLAEFDYYSAHYPRRDRWWH